VLASLAAIAFAVLAALVATGQLTSIDQYAVAELMPGINPPHRESGFLFDVVPLADVRNETAIQVVVNVFTLPASAALSSLAFGAGAWLLRRRGARRIALLWLAAFVAANAVELVVKTLLERPSLTARVGMRVYKVGFDHAFPSGHAVRALLVAGLCACLWPHTRRYVLVWAVLTLPALEVAGFHTPSDIAGGAILALLLIALVRQESAFALEHSRE
jgi:membrane-associated phospholipid phosphatase